MQLYTTILLEKKQIATDVFQIRTTKPEEFTYTPGQFVQWSIPTHEQSAPIYRSYSLSSHPHDDYLEYCIKLIPNGKASTHIAHMHIGEQLTIKGPVGRFVQTHTATPLYFIATGTGLAPIMSILQDEIIYKHTTKSIHVLFGVRHAEDVFWQDRLEQFAQHSHVTVGICLSGNTTENTTLFQSGRVTEHIKIDVEGRYFLCGNKQMVIDVRTMLTQAQVPASAIHMEIF